MTYQIFQLPKQTLIGSAAIKPSWKVSFFLTGTTTPTPVYTTSALSTAHTQPVQADSGGTLATVYLDPAIVYKASVYDQNDVLQYTVDPVNDSLLSQAAIGLLLYPRTAAEISAGVTPTNYAYPPGDLRRYGAAIDNATNDATAWTNCLAANGLVLPWDGTSLVTSTITLPADGSCITGARGQSILRYSGSAVGISFNGKDYCTVEDVRILAASATKAVYVGDIAHWAAVRGCDIRGSSTGDNLSGTVSSGTGIEVERSYYADITGNDISYFTKGVYGFREFNGDMIHANSIRQCYRAVHVSDATSNTEGSQVVNNAIESAQASTVAGVDIEGADSIVVAHNRIELTVASQASIYVHGGTGASMRCDIDGNEVVGTVAAIKIGTGSGSNNVQRCRVRGGYYNGTCAINSDADYTVWEVDRRFIQDGSGNLSNSSTSTILSYVDDSGFTATATGMTGSVTAIWKYQVAKGIVTLFAQALSGTSNATTFTVTGLPSLIRPTNSQTVLCIVIDNGGAAAVGKGVIDSSGVMTLSSNVNGAAFTGSGNKQFVGCVITYPLN